MEIMEKEFSDIKNVDIAKLYQNCSEVRQLLNNQFRSLKSDCTWNTRSPKSLVDIILGVVASNFIDFIHYYDSNEFKKYEQQFLYILPTDLPLQATVAIIPDGIYWKRVCYDKWGEGNFLLHFKDSWKNLYLQTVLQNYIENANPANVNLNELKELVDLVKDYVQTLYIQQLLAVEMSRNSEDHIKHIDLQQIILSLTSLTEISIKGAFISSNSRLFSSNTSQLTNTDCFNIAKGLEKSINLKILKIHQCSLNTNKLRTILSGILLLPNLQQLELTSCSISDDSIAPLGESLISFISLKSLILTNNNIGSRGISFLAPALQNCDALTELDLRLNFIKDDGARELLVALRDHTSLEVLILSSCKITNNSTEELAAFISSNKKALKLDLSCNDLGETAGPPLIQALKNNTNLRNLTLKMNGICSDHIERIRNILKSNIKRIYIL